MKGSISQLELERKVASATQLGDLLALSQRSSRDLEGWFASQGEEFVEGIAEQAAIRGETLAQFVRIAVSDFLAEADEESWADLVSAIRDADDAGASFVSKMIAFRLRLEKAS